MLRNNIGAGEPGNSEHAVGTNFELNMNIDEVLVSIGRSLRQNAQGLLWHQSLIQNVLYHEFQDNTISERCSVA